MAEWVMPGIPRTIAESPDMETVERIRASVTSDTGQVVESDLLLDCPFCGGRPWVHVYELDETCVEARVVCGGCHVSTARKHQSWKVSYEGDDLTRTLAIGRAVSAWNRRAGRTCRNVCEWNTSGTFHFTCSECGAEVCCDDWGESPVFVGDYKEPLRYCPSCGAKVVDDDADE